MAGFFFALGVGLRRHQQDGCLITLKALRLQKFTEAMLLLIGLQLGLNQGGSGRFNNNTSFDCTLPLSFNGIIRVVACPDHPLKLGLGSFTNTSFQVLSDTNTTYYISWIAAGK